MALIAAHSMHCDAGEVENPPEASSTNSPSQLLLAPFAAPRANFFHAALGVPEFESARTLDPGSVYLRLQTAHAQSREKRTIAGYTNDFNGLYHQWAALEAKWGVIDRLELSANTVFAGWDETLDRFRLYDDKGTPIVTDEAQTINGTGASKRHDNFSTVGFEAKGLLLKAEDAGLDVSVATSIKFPIGRDRDLTDGGTYDLAFSLLGSLPLGRVEVHANVGVIVPLGSQNLFIHEANVDLNPFVFGGFGAVVRLPSDFAVGIQLEANSSAFGDVNFLEEAPITVTGGVRKLFGHLVLESGGGAGLNTKSSYEWMFFLSAGYVF